MKTSTSILPTSSTQPNSPTLAQRQCACGQPASELTGECSECSRASSFGLQAKLVVGASDDPLEREADRVAEQVMRMPNPNLRGPQQVLDDNREPARTTPMLQARPTLTTTLHTSLPGNHSAPTSVQTALSSPGQPLGSDERQFFESRFGQDFSRVRIHTDPTAARSAQEVGAQAYTVGHRVAFNQGRYAPNTPSGRELLAHELTHVVQQTTRGFPTQLRRRGDDENGPAAAQDSDIEYDEVDINGPAPINPSDPVVLITLNGGKVTFYTASERTFTGTSNTDLQAGNYTLEVDFTRKRWWIEEDVPTGQRFHVDSLNADPWALPYAGKVVLQVGTSAIADTPEMSVDERIGKVRSLLENTWTDGDDEEELIALIRGVPPSQAQEFFDRLQSEMIDDKTLYERLDSDVHGENNLILHEALSLLRMKTLGTEEGAKALANAPVIPWHDVMGFFETSVTFTAKPLRGGKIKIEFIRGAQLKAGTEFDQELDQLPFDMFVGGQVYDANTVLIIHDYDQGRFVPVTAGELAGYQHAGVRKFLSDIGTIAQFAVPVSAARSAAGKVAVIALERVLPAAVLLVDENRLNIARWFPQWGPKMIHYSDIVKTGLAAYGIASFAVSGYKVFQQWKQVRGARLSLDGPAPDADAERIALKMESQADAIIGEAEKIYDAEKAAKNASPLDDIDLGKAGDDIKLPPKQVEAPPSPAPKSSPGKSSAPTKPAKKAAPASSSPRPSTAKADVVEAVPASPAAREAAVTRGISDETVTLFQEKPQLKEALVANPHAARALKLCNSPCYPEFITKAQIERLDRLFKDAEKLDLVGGKTNWVAIRRFLHGQDNVDDFERAIGLIEGQFADAAEGLDLAKLQEAAADLAEASAKGPDQARHALPSSSTVARNRAGTVSGGKQLADVTDAWFPINKKTEAPARVAAIPGQIARKMRRIKHFKSFRDFRETFWKLVAEDPVLGRPKTTTNPAGWSKSNISRMEQGYAPWAPSGERLGGGSNAKWQLNHKQAIKSDGDVYNLDNIEIVTPAFHKDVGD